MVLLQIDFPFTGPWGDEMAEAMRDLATDIASEDGLIWKIWTENADEGRAGGIYVFSDAASAERYEAKHTARLIQFGIGGIVAKRFEINGPLSELTRAPL